MSNTPVQDNIRAYALDQVGAACIMGATAVKCTPKYWCSLADLHSAVVALVNAVRSGVRISSSVPLPLYFVKHANPCNTCIGRITSNTASKRRFVRVFANFS